MNVKKVFPKFGDYKGEQLSCMKLRNFHTADNDYIIMDNDLKLISHGRA